MQENNKEHFITATQVQDILLNGKITRECIDWMRKEKCGPFFQYSACDKCRKRFDHNVINETNIFYEYRYIPKWFHKECKNSHEK